MIVYDSYWIFTLDFPLINQKTFLYLFIGERDFIVNNLIDKTLGLWDYKSAHANYYIFSPVMIFITNCENHPAEH